MPNAQVTLTQTPTAAVRQTLTNEHGQFNAPFIPHGDYSVAVAAPGSQTKMLTGINLQVDQTANLRIRLDIGQMRSLICGGPIPRRVTSAWFSFPKRRCSTRCNRAQQTTTPSQCVEPIRHFSIPISSAMPSLRPCDSVAPQVSVYRHSGQGEAHAHHQKDIRQAGSRSYGCLPRQLRCGTGYRVAELGNAGIGSREGRLRQRGDWLV